MTKKLRYISLLILLLGLGFKGWSQITISPQEPFISFTFLELWAVNITGGSLPNAVLQLNVIDKSTSKTILICNSGTISLVSGLNSINASSLGVRPLRYDFIDPQFRQQFSEIEFFPVGEYSFIYNLIKASSGAVVSSYAFDRSIELSFPPMLISPNDGDTLQTLNPLFSWSPAFSGQQRISYEFLLVEINESQNAEQALNINPLIHRQDVGVSTLQYPGSGQKLKFNQWYGWRVLAKISKTSIGRSESWRFIIKKPTPDSCKPKPANHFYELNRETSSSFVTVDQGQLNFIFNERYMVEDELHFTIYTADNKIIATEKQLGRPWNAGLNKISILLRSTEIGLKKGLYILEISGAKGINWYMRFKNQSDIDPCKP